MNDNLVEKYLWVEKYRPSKLEDLILPDNYRKKFEQFVQQKEIPHLLFYGPPGSGKTTIARILIDIVTPDSNNTYWINGSSDTGVNFIRTEVEEFLKCSSFGEDSLKIVFIDEADYLSKNAQASLRGIVEKYSDTNRFIFTANYISKIEPALISRFADFEFKKVPKSFIVDNCKNILNTEGIKYEDESIEKLVNTFYPDIRKVINTMQSRIDNNSFIITNKDLESNEKLFLSYLIDMINGIFDNNIPTIIKDSISKMMNMLKESELDYVSFYELCFNDNNIPIWAKMKVNEYASKHQSCMIPSMNIISMCYDILKVGTDLKQIVKRS